MVWTRPFVHMFIATFGAFYCFFSLLPVTPLWATAGGAAPWGAGATTGTMMLTTVLGQLCMPWLLRRYDLRTMLGVGLVLLGTPTPLYGLSADLPPLLVISAVSGIGFGMVTVSGSALASVLVPPSRQGQAVGLYGFAVGIPALVGMPMALWATTHVGFRPLFTVAGVMTLLGTFLVRRIPRSACVPARTPPRAGGSDGTALRQLIGPWLLIVSTGTAMGGIATFLPIATADQDGLAGMGLLLLTAFMTISRYCAGLAGDRLGAGRLLVPGMALAVSGMAVLTMGATAAILIGAAVFGVGYGIVQNQSLVVMFDRADVGTASTVWNTGLDGGFCVAGYGLGLVISGYGFASGFAVSAVLMLLCLPVAAATCTVRAKRAAGRESPRQYAKAGSPAGQ